ncbi:MAG: hypothetical protein ACHREM_06345 [Polyangiales bacterium]
MWANHAPPKGISRATIDQLTDGQIDGVLLFIGEHLLLADAIGDRWVPEHVFAGANPTFPGPLAYEACRRWGIVFEMLESRERPGGGHDCRAVWIPDSRMHPRVLARMKLQIVEDQAPVSAAIRFQN